MLAGQAAQFGTDPAREQAQVEAFGYRRLVGLGRQTRTRRQARFRLAAVGTP
ncbi:MAG TPA: hypothetical protein PLE12_02820 [Propionicimonas sp.]|nr:hypothetical protein [Propionicimonas sp.]